MVLLTSPQSYVEEGIAPDLFMANFSEQQYLELMADEDFPEEIKRYISARALELFERYAVTEDTAELDTGIRWLAEYTANPSPAAAVRNVALAPYYAFRRYLNDLKDKTDARALLESVEDTVSAVPASIDWEKEEQAALADASRMTDNNDFGILNDYYTTYIGTRLARQKDKDAGLSYSVSQEYDDLRILFEVCRRKGLSRYLSTFPSTESGATTPASRASVGGSITATWRQSPKNTALKH